MMLQDCPKCGKEVHYVDPPGWHVHEDGELDCWAQALPAWKIAFYEAIAAYLRREDPQSNIARVVDIEEHKEYGFRGSDVTAGDDPWLELHIAWVDADAGFTRTSKYFGSLTELINELDRP